MHTLGSFSVRAVCTLSVIAAPYSDTWQWWMPGKSWGSIVWKASNTLPTLVGIIYHDAGVIWVEKQQLSNHNWNNVGLEGKNNYPDKITSNILKYVLPWIWLCWCKQIPYKWDPKCCSPWGNIDHMKTQNTLNIHQLPVFQTVILSLPLTSLRFPSKASLTVLF